MAIKTFWKKFSLPLWFFIFYILFHIYKTVNNSNSEIIYTYHIIHNLDISTVLLLNLPFLLVSLLLIYVPVTRNALWREKRQITQGLAGEGREPASVEHFLSVRHLVRHKCYLISDLTVGVVPLYIWKLKNLRNCKLSFCRAFEILLPGSCCQFVSNKVL